MSTVVTKTITSSQAVTALLLNAGELLGLSDQKALNAAMLKVAYDNACASADFASAVQLEYHRIASRAKPRRATQAKRTDIVLMPIKRIEGREANPAAPPDPYFLLDLYGPNQLRLALTRYKKPQLLEVVSGLQEERIGAKPTNRSRIDALIDYIVEHVAGPGY